MTDDSSGSEEWRIDRRTVLRTAAISGAGLVGASAFGGTATARGGKPCHKSFGCEEGTYVKFEFVEDDGMCYFVEETDTGIFGGETGSLEVTETKEGDSCEPTRVEWDDENYVATKVMAFGGNDCDTVSYPGGYYDARGAEEDDDRDGLTNGGGNTAAISNLQFCVEFRDFLGTINLSYEDLPMDDSDWDYNDWTVDLLGEYDAVGVMDGDPLVESFTFDIVPQARGAADNHAWGVILPTETLCGGGSYHLAVKDDTGATMMDESDTFDGSSDVDIEVFPETDDVLANLANTGGSCATPNYWATLTVEFDEACPIDVPVDENDLDVHASDLFVDPYLDNLDKDVYVDRGDTRLLAVPQDWMWPFEREHIADAYEQVSGAPGVPSFDSDTWYDEGYDATLVTQCDVDPSDLGGM